MTDKISEQTKVTTESEISSNGVGHSNTHGSSGEVMASPEELTLALESSSRTIDALRKENEALKKAQASESSESSIDKLANVITAALAKKETPVGPTAENVNKSTDFSQRTLIDGNNMMEAQATLMSFKSEHKIPISIPKTFMNQFGPSLAVSVNGVRVSIPCDGKTYYINETHAEAAKERMAKVDRLLADTEPQIKEINA